MLKRALHTLTFCLLGMVALGCTSTDTIDPQPVPLTIPQNNQQFTFPRLDPTNGIIPLPNELLITNNQVALPGTGEPFDAINSLRGFSTAGNIIIPFTGSVDQATVNNTTVRLYEVVSRRQITLTFTVTTDAAGNSTIIAASVRPLTPNTGHVVVLTESILRPGSGTSIIADNTIRFSRSRTALVDAQGNSLEPLLSNAQAQQLEQLRQVTQNTWDNAEDASGLFRENIPLAFGFVTQNVGLALPAARSVVTAANSPLVAGAAPLTPAAWNALLPATLQGALAAVIPNLTAGGTRVVVGNINSPSFRTIPVANSIWQTDAAGIPPSVAPTSRNIPFVAFLPNAGVSGPGPYPTVIFQHGLTVSKEFASILAAAFNPQGIAVVAIDLELHGALTEGASSGDGFINLTNLRNSRDNIRQSVVNLYALTHAITSGQADIDGAAGTDLAPVPPFFVGHSLGGIVGTVFLATETNVGRGILNATGGRISNLLLNSTQIGPTVVAGLAAQGVQQNTSQFLQFLLTR